MVLLAGTGRLTALALLPYFAALGVASVVALHLRRHRSEAGVGVLLALAVVTGVWATLHLVGPVTAAGTERLLVQGRLAAAALAPLGWFLFAVGYTGRARMLRGPLGLTVVVPVATALLAFTNSRHGLVWDDLRIRPSGAVLADPGPWTAIHVAYSIALVVAATGVLVWHHAQSPHGRGRLVVVVTAPLALLAPDLLRLSFPEAWPTPGFDPTPLGHALGLAVLTLGLIREGRLVTAPVARTIVVEEMRDPVLVLDRRGRIIDLNRAARRTLGLERGGPLPVVLGTTWAVGHRKAVDADLPPERISLETPEGVERVYEMTLTALGPRGGAGRTVIVLRDVTVRDRMERELRRATAELERLALTDPLTGVANRRAFMAALEREAERVRRYGRPLSLVMLDLDHFKRVNDRYGHAAGDAVLRAAGEAMRGVSREIDLPARLGGEELAILLPETSVDGAAVVAERLRGLVASEVHLTEEGATFRVTASLGVASLEVGTGGTPEALLAAADEALYAAKEGGRNRVVTASGAS